jgi:hypothetical protein
MVIFQQTMFHIVYLLVGIQGIPHAFWKAHNTSFLKINWNEVVLSAFQDCGITR